MSSAITRTASTNKLTDIREGSPNRLLYSLLTGEVILPPPPTPEPEAPCTKCTLFEGTLEEGSREVHPDRGYFSTSGTHKGWLEGPAEANFDLFLYHWVGRGWRLVARAEGASSSEAIIHRGPTGIYTWVVYAADGSGSYKFWLKQP